MTPRDVVVGPRPASLALRVMAQVMFESRLLLRNGEQFVLAVVIPLLALVGSARTSILTVSATGDEPRIQVVTPGILALAILATAFTAQAISVGFDRRYGVLRLLGVTPLGKSGLLLGKVGAVALIIAGQLVVLSLAAVALGWRPRGNPLWVVLLVGLGIAAFTSLALLLAGTLRAEATLAVANLVFVLLLFAGGLVVPLDRFPDGAEAVLSLLPTAALADGLRDVLTLGQAPSASALAVLVLWTALAAPAAVRWFHWD